jgi:hypothetical protein
MVTITPEFWSNPMSDNPITDSPMLSLGEKRVRSSFNPSKDSLVDQIKQKTAELIDLCAAKQRMASQGEEIRLWSLALTAYEEAAMWGVKAATIEK